MICWKYLIVLKAEVGKLDINKLANGPISLNSQKKNKKIEDLEIGKSKTVLFYRGWWLSKFSNGNTSILYTPQKTIFANLH